MRFRRMKRRRYGRGRFRGRRSFRRARRGRSMNRRLLRVGYRM